MRTLAAAAVAVIVHSLLGSTEALAQRSNSGLRSFPRYVSNPMLRPLTLNTNLVGWSIEGQGYELRCDEIVPSCAAALFRSRPLATSPQGALVHREWAAPWRGATVEAKAEARPGGVSGQATLFIRAEDAQGRTLATSHGPPMSSTTPFQHQRVSLVVPPEAERLTIGFEILGTGAVFVRQIVFDDAELLASASP